MATSLLSKKITEVTNLESTIAALRECQTDFWSMRTANGCTIVRIDQPSDKRTSVINLLFTPSGELHPMGLMCSMNTKQLNLHMKGLRAKHLSLQPKSQVL